jgi:hypothetical protein
MPQKNLTTTATIAVNNAKTDFAIRNVKWHILPIIQIEAMTKGYTVENGLTWDGQNIFVVSNYPPLNKVRTAGFVTLPTIQKNYDIGVWKIKKLKQ